jgi:hypothetical protein
VNWHGRGCCRPNRYPVVRQAQNASILFGKTDGAARFGTEGSEVRIISPDQSHSRETHAKGPGNRAFCRTAALAGRAGSVTRWAEGFASCQSGCQRDCVIGSSKILSPSSMSLTCGRSVISRESPGTNSTTRTSITTRLAPGLSSRQLGSCRATDRRRSERA